MGLSRGRSVLLTLSIIKDPVLLESRTKGGPTAEERPIQKIIVLCTGLLYITSFAVSGLDRRFGWSRMPAWLSIIGYFLIMVSIWMVYRVFKENSFGSSIVEIGKDQKLISTGPYAIVRNPMYASAAVYFIGMSLALGSYWGLAPSVLTILGLACGFSTKKSSLPRICLAIRNVVPKYGGTLCLVFFNPICKIKRRLADGILQPKRMV
jgi:protein-S-isoprenylcysteine O-methyltransferase Ste14